MTAHIEMFPVSTLLQVLILHPVRPVGQIHLADPVVTEKSFGWTVAVCFQKVSAKALNVFSQAAALGLKTAEPVVKVSESLAQPEFS